MSNKYIIIIGDIVASKKIKNRKKFQKQLENIMKYVNKESKNILSPYTITLGDEFQAVLKNTEHLFLYLLMITNMVFPVEFRFSISLGNIDTNINKNLAVGMDGPAFHSGRKGIIALKENQEYIKITTPDNKFDVLFSSIVDLILKDIYKHKGANRAHLFVQIMQGNSSSMIAEKDGVSQWSVNKNISNWNIQKKILQMKEVEVFLGELL